MHKQNMMGTATTGGASQESLLVDERKMARLLGISARKLAGLRYERKVPFVSIGSRILYLPSAVLEKVLVGV